MKKIKNISKNLRSVEKYMDKIIETVIKIKYKDRTDNDKKWFEKHENFLDYLGEYMGIKGIRVISD